MRGLENASIRNEHGAGPGSQSVLANMMVGNVQHVDYAAGFLDRVKAHGHSRIDPTQVAEASSRLPRLKVENYMVHVNKDDQGKVFIPYTGGLPAYVQHCTRVAENGYQGYRFA